MICHAEPLEDTPGDEEEEDQERFSKLSIDDQEIMIIKGQKVIKTKVDDPRQREADKKGYGKLYATFDTHEKGLAACEAGTPLLPLPLPLHLLHHLLMFGAILIET